MKKIYLHVALRCRSNEITIGLAEVLSLTVFTIACKVMAASLMSSWFALVKITTTTSSYAIECLYQRDANKILCEEKQVLNPQKGVSGTHRFKLWIW